MNILFKIFIISGYTRYQLLHAGFLQLWQAGSLFFVVHQLLTAVASLAVEHRLQVYGLSSCGPQALLGSPIVVHGLCCPVAHGLSLDQGSNLCPLHWQAVSYPLYHQGSPRLIYYYQIYKSYVSAYKISLARCQICYICNCSLKYPGKFNYLNFNQLNIQEVFSRLSL